MTAKMPVKKRFHSTEFGEGGGAFAQASNVFLSDLPDELLLRISKWAGNPSLGLVDRRFCDIFETHCSDVLKAAFGFPKRVRIEPIEIKSKIAAKCELNLDEFNPAEDSFSKLAKKVYLFQKRKFKEYRLEFEPVLDVESIAERQGRIHQTDVRNLSILFRKISFRLFRRNALVDLEEDQEPLIFMRNWLNQNKERLKEIRFLELCNRNLTAIPKEILLFDNLQALILRGNIINAIPQWIENLTHLEQLDLAQNLITEIPSQIGNLRKLKRLFLSYNQLRALPSDVAFRGLTSLGLAYNQISHLPDWIGQQVALEVLDFSSNRLQMLPHNLNNLRRLREISFYNNPELNLQELKANFANHPFILARALALENMQEREEPGYRQLEIDGLYF